MKSMTGYSKLSYQDEKYTLDMEIKSVNNKNLNLKIKLPTALNFLEKLIRMEVASKINRGSVDLRIDFTELDQDSNLFEYDKVQSDGYMELLSKMEEDYSQKFLSKLDILVRNLSVIKKKETPLDEKSYEDIIITKLNELLEVFIKSREDEGNRLRTYLFERLDVLSKNIEEIKKHKGEVVESYKAKLLSRIQSIEEKIQINEEDILKEILLFADRSDISEEISRLDSHMTQLKKEFMEDSEPVGKKIDFILQEIFRELNTTGVKSNCYEISKLVVECKNELEKIREQTMNIE